VAVLELHGILGMGRDIKDRWTGWICGVDSRKTAMISILYADNDFVFRIYCFSRSIYYSFT